MANASWTVTVGGNAVTNIQTVNIRKGRTDLTEAYRSGSLTIIGRRPDLLPAIAIGDVISATMTFLSSTAPYSFRVTNLTVNYGIVAAQDEWVLEGEDAMGYAGRALIDATWSSGANAYTVAGTVGTSAGTTVTNPTILSSTTTVSGQTLTNTSALQILTNLINSEGGILAAGATSIFWLPRNWQTVAGIPGNFTDTGTGANPVYYDRVEFAALADTAVTKVIVEPVGLASQSSGTGTNVYSITTYSQTTTDAADVAAFNAGSLNVTTPAPVSVSLLLTTQANAAALNVLPEGTAIDIKLRGTTYETLVLGTVISSNPDTTRITYNVISADFYKYLILDDAVYGKLDFNRLGW